MARPRVFISSTFYDLKQVRSDLEAFIKSIGYDAVLHERGAVPYGSKEKLEEYCYREIQHVEILVSIVGGRYGSQSTHEPYSVSQQELKTAYELGVQVFIFVEAQVLSEYQTYLKNKSVPGVFFNYVDDNRIYKFLEELHALPNNNPITPFASAQEIVAFLREQWAGMFQRFLQNQEREKEVQIVKDLQENMQTLNQLIGYLTEEKQNSDLAIREILRANHPIFGQLRKILNIPYRVFFTTRAEFSQWLKSRQFTALKPDSWDDLEHEEWIKDEPNNKYKLLKVATTVFDEKGDLVIRRNNGTQIGFLSQSSNASQNPFPSWCRFRTMTFRFEPLAFLRPGTASGLVGIWLKALTVDLLVQAQEVFEAVGQQVNEKTATMTDRMRQPDQNGVQNGPCLDPVAAMEISVSV